MRRPGEIKGSRLIEEIEAISYQLSLIVEKLQKLL
jgi:hypothetical protein